MFLTRSQYEAAEGSKSLERGSPIPPFLLCFPRKINTLCCHRHSSVRRGASSDENLLWFLIIPRCFFRGRDQSRWALERGGQARRRTQQVVASGFLVVTEFSQSALLCRSLLGAALYLWRRGASNEQRVVCFVGLDTGLVLSATWVIYVGVAQGTCRLMPAKSLMMSWRVGSTAQLTRASLVGALPLQTPGEDRRGRHLTEKVYAS